MAFLLSEAVHTAAGCPAASLRCPCRWGGGCAARAQGPLLWDGYGAWAVPALEQCGVAGIAGAPDGVAMGLWSFERQRQPFQVLLTRLRCWQGRLWAPGCSSRCWVVWVQADTGGCAWTVEGW